MELDRWAKDPALAPAGARQLAVDAARALGSLVETTGAVDRAGAGKAAGRRGRAAGTLKDQCVVFGWAVFLAGIIFIKKTN